MPIWSYQVIDMSQTRCTSIDNQPVLLQCAHSLRKLGGRTKRFAQTILTPDWESIFVQRIRRRCSKSISDSVTNAANMHTLFIIVETDKKQL